VLNAASLMVSGPAAADAVRRARTMPSLRVGLHLVVIEGQATLPPGQIPDLVDATGRFGSDQFRRGVCYFCRPTVRRQLAAEIEAQFAAFAATGLTLGHADAHKHMHLHPTIGRLLIDTGRRYGLPRIRVPAEPPAVMRACGEQPGLGAWALHAWTQVLRRQVRRAGMHADDQVFGITWTGHVTAPRLRLLLELLPDGSSEIYAHPAVRQDTTLRRLMPDYDPAGELAALCDRKVAELHGSASAVPLAVPARA
jgi:hopanoid biosynthesis associated protein HpnK